MWLISMVNLGKYTSPMDGMETNCLAFRYQVAAKLVLGENFQTKIHTETETVLLFSADA